jgi:demethylmenaquinone methyltransferase/2-methoxy-6-polyprenyl-1,4-benzoquinol methylase
MKVLDVAIGTGLVAREAIALTGSERNVIGLDPSTGMLAEARRKLTVRVIQATGEQLPVAPASFDFVSMGYALRHLSDLSAALREFRRVLRPDGRLCILELTRPRGRLATSLLRGYMRYVIPRLSRLNGGQADELLWRYYWDTIEACLPPEQVLNALNTAGFQQVGRHVELKIFSEYTASA